MAQIQAKDLVYTDEFADYLRTILNMDLRDFLADEHNVARSPYVDPDCLKYQEDLTYVLKIFPLWVRLRENNIEPDTDFSWLNEVETLETTFECKYCFLTRPCEVCIRLGYVSPFMRTLIASPNKSSERNEQEQERLDLSSPGRFYKEDDMELMQEIEECLAFSALSVVQETDSDNSEVKCQELQQQEKQQRHIELQQPHAKQQQNELHQQKQASTNLPNEDIGFAEQSSGSDSDSSGESEDEESTDENNVNQKLSVLVTPPNSNESVQYNRLNTNRLDTVAQTYEIKNTGEMKNTTSSCERMTRFTNFCLNDHSYYQNQPHNLECLGIQTPSESEDEEIDVVTYRASGQRGAPASLLQQRPAQQRQRSTARATGDMAPPPRRPRGRPPANASRKRPAQVSQNDLQQQPSAKRQRRRRPQTSKSRNSSDEEAEEQDRRNLHNDMERQRRVELRNQFEELRLLVPATEKVRAPKVKILTEATKYCDSLIEESEVLKKQRAALLEQTRQRTGVIKRLRAMSSKLSRK